MKSLNGSKELTIVASQSFKEREYWLKKLAGELEYCTFPYDLKTFNQGMETNEKEMKKEEFTIPDQVFDQSMRISNRSDMRLHMILVTGLMVLLNKYTGIRDIIIGIPVERQKIEGEFINTVLAIRGFITENVTFKELLLQVRKTIMEAIENQNYPINALLYDLGLEMNKSQFPLFDTAVLLENLHERKYLQQVDCSSIFSFKSTENNIRGCVEYNPIRYEPATIGRIIRHFQKVLLEGLTDVDAPMDQVDILSPEEKHQLLFDFNNRPLDSPRAIITSFPVGKTIHDLFEEQAAGKPGNIAVKFEKEQLTYGQLNEKTDHLAMILRSRGVRPDDIVGILLERSLEMIAAILGVLKAGGAYCPIDPEYPLERVSYIIKDSDLEFLITNRKFPEFKGEVIPLKSVHHLQAPGEEGSPLCSVNNNHGNAYIIYTSGSSGRPKGVVVSHASIINTLNWRKNFYAFDQQDVVLQLPSFSFDSSVEDIFTPLISGSRLILIREEKRFEMEYLGEVIEENKVTHFLIVPDLYQTFLEIIGNRLIGLKMVTIAGEHFTSELVKQHFEKLSHVKLVNEYGPTENSVCSTAYEFKPDQTRVLIGKPIDQVNCFVLDRSWDLLPIGTPGELCLSGVGLARGYLNRPELTAEKFVISHLSLVVGSSKSSLKTDDRSSRLSSNDRLYKTGDLARWLSDGNLEFLGRIDQQVKIRGYRVELGEIESHLQKYQGVRKAVVITRESKIGNKMLCAYMVMSDNEMEFNVAGIIDYLSQRLPDYMVPAYFFKLEQIPLTPNGKIDRKKLPDQEKYLNIDADYEPPRNQSEEILVEIWKQELGLEKVGIKDNYFSIGGDSIKSIRLVSIINEKLDKKLKIVDLYVNNTIEKLARLLEEEAAPHPEETHTETLKELDALKTRILQG